MKKLSLLAALFVSYSFLSFTKVPPATTFTTNDVVPFNATVFIPCANGGAGEFVDLSGPLHIVTHVTINGNNVIIKQHFQPQGVSGTGQITGDSYNATGVTQSESKTSLQNGQAESTFINNFRIIGQGPNNNFLVHTTIHQTINANGTVTSDVLNTSVECQ